MAYRYRFVLLDNEKSEKLFRNVYRHWTAILHWLTAAVVASARMGYTRVAILDGRGSREPKHILIASFGAGEFASLEQERA